MTGFAADVNAADRQGSLAIVLRIMIDDVLDLRVFVRVVATGSLSAAARDLGLSLAVVSKRLAALEHRLGLVLLRRTTRSQSLTVEGRAFHERCVRILAEVQDAEAYIAGSQGTVTGVLSITAPRVFGREYAAPLVAAFQAAHPALSVRLLCSDEIVDLIDGGIDVAFRFGSLLDSSLTARHIAPDYRVLCAAPAYIARAGQPTQPSHLRDHACIIYGPRPAAHWLFQRAGKPIAQEVRASFIVNDGATALALALAGAGIHFKSIWEVGDHLRAGRLVRVMTEFAAPTAPLHAVFPHGRQLAPRVRQFVDFAVERLRATWPSVDAPPSKRRRKLA